MKRRFAKCAMAALLLPLLLTGCWDIKDIQDINYVNAIGFDFKDDQYIVWVQMIDFSTVAKMESGKSTQHVPVWIGTGKGNSPAMALDDLYRSAQLRIFYGQINAVVLSENVLKKGTQEVADLQRRYFEMRYTPWIYGTKQPIGELFAIVPFFNLSPISSMLHQPLESYRQEAIIAPLSTREFASSIREPGNSTILPSIGITTSHWKEDTKPHPMLTFDGVFALQNGTYKGWLSEQQAPGLRWLNPETNRSPVALTSGNKPEADLSLERPKVNVTARVKNGKPSYSIRVRLTGNVNQLFTPISEEELERRAAERVLADIRRTFEEGLAIHADLLQLQHALYKQRNRQWKKINREDGGISPETKVDIRVSVKLIHAGKLKI